MLRIVRTSAGDIRLAFSQLEQSRLKELCRVAGVRAGGRSKTSFVEALAGREVAEYRGVLPKLVRGELHAICDVLGVDGRKLNKNALVDAVLAALQASAEGEPDERAPRLPQGGRYNLHCP